MTGHTSTNQNKMSSTVVGNKTLWTQGLGRALGLKLRSMNPAKDLPAPPHNKPCPPWVSNKCSQCARVHRPTLLRAAKDNKLQSSRREFWMGLEWSTTTARVVFGRNVRTVTMDHGAALGGLLWSAKEQLLALKKFSSMWSPFLGLQ